MRRWDEIAMGEPCGKKYSAHLQYPILCITGLSTIDQVRTQTSAISRWWMKKSASE
jgi:hypothetical protein